MPDVTTYLAFLAAVLTYQLSGVGPDMMLVISRGVGQGWRHALSTAAGCVSAGVVQIPLLAMGLASLVTSSPSLYCILQVVGAVYLIAIGIKFLLARRQGEDGGVFATKSSIPAAFRQGLVCNLTNPTTLAFMLAVLPQFVHPSAGSPALQFIVLGATMKMTGMVVLGAVALTSGAIGDWLARRSSLLIWQQRLSGALMVAIGIRLLLAAVSGRR
ncbi:MAG: LysE family translocator [Mesorhizobium sp.]|uniref:LysE family translocator n=1 Tax=unclassified Mesorhizobium TaxID=325217 RepID=UPI000FE9879C|nr:MULTISPECIES: LysE family translocator [unclassified Mesorhizobium]RWC91598.1 MAG: LysE family translocator [Mesorhizobium sp.]RWE39783.1 MAG: LysE family translocator [Mesorhizobium sp.]TGQ83672.1 LysE family translocator [Mesorhizobium sp. M8A.F.Ca.ET.207.01.1.1]TIT36913.1 MAG: LysE family translocator [Mesorhizobium sp.]